MRRLRALVVTAAVLALSGCASLGPDTAAAARIAQNFHTALSAGDGAAGCAVLAPATVEQLEKTTKAPCMDGIVGEDLPAAGSVIDVRAYGRAAQVRMDTDTVFLTIADGEWKVTAAGCRPEPGGPYDCVIEGP